MNKKIIITGNAGMIGSVLSNYFINKNYEVVGIDNLFGGLEKNIHKNVKFYKADICDHNEINKIFKEENPSYVIHCAAYAAEILSPFVRNFNYKTNLIGSINLINASVNFNIEKFINFSSIATYGDAHAPFLETHNRNPKDCYGIAKLAVEMDLKEAYEHFGLKYVSLLPHNVISKYQNYYDKYRNVIAIWIRQCIQKEKITIFGDGLQKRAFSEAKFLCEPIEKLLYEYEDEVFNIGSDNVVSIKNAAELIIKVAKKYGFDNEIIFLEPRREVKYAYSDHSKASLKLGFKDETNLEETISEMFDYAIKQEQLPINKMEYEIEKNIYSYWK
jgi:UDP-glucose 4-epimerase